MCLQIRHKFPKIAWKDIPVYKVLIKKEREDGTYYLSPICYREYTPNIVYKENWNVGLRGRKKDKGWIHSFYRASAALALTQFLQRNNEILYRTVHMTELDSYKCSLVIVRAVIPKYTLYYEGLCGDICSKKLKLTEDNIYQQLVTADVSII